MIPRLKEQFNTELKQKIMSDLQLSNVNEIPSLEKIIINIGDCLLYTSDAADD